jgi:uncharacterized membrane protein YkgB
LAAFVPFTSMANEVPNVGPEKSEHSQELTPPGTPTPERLAAGRSSDAVESDERIYRAGLVIGAVALVMALGVIKDVWALVKPSGEGVLVFGFLMVRYSSLYRVWFGYGFTDTAAWYATIPHVILYGAGAYGLVMRRHWGWVLLSVYLLYIPISEVLYALIGGSGYFGRTVIPADILWAHVPYYAVLVLLIGFVEWRLWKCRDLFVR